MNLSIRGLALASAVMLALAGGISGCGSGSDGVKIALLLPEDEMPRYESTDRPAFEKRVEQICGDCEVVYGNAKLKISRQRRQAEAALRDGADVLVLDPVVPEHGGAIVEKARALDVPVLNYDSLILESKPDVFVSFDIVQEGELMAEALAERLAKSGAPGGPVVMINGEPGNEDQPRFEEGAERGFEAANVRIARRDYTPFWEASAARDEMQMAIDVLGARAFAGVYAETDGIAKGVIAAMKEAGINPATKPTTGRDATLAGVHRILDGQQYMTIYEPADQEASTAADIALSLAEGHGVPPQESTEQLGEDGSQVPAVLLEPVVVTKANAKRILATRETEIGLRQRP